MAMVARGHGGDNGPSNDDRLWEPPSIHKNAKGRKKGSDAKLIKKFEDGKKKISIDFDITDQNTAKLVGDNNRNFTGLIGNEIERSILFCYESWEVVPDKYKGTLWLAIHVCVGGGKTIPVTNTSHSILPTLSRPLYLHNVLVTPNIIKNLISVRQFTRDTKCSVEFDEFGFFVKDFLTRHILLRCDSSGDLYPVTKTSPTPSALLSISPSMWHQRLGHPAQEQPSITTAHSLTPTGPSPAAYSPIPATTSAQQPPTRTHPMVTRAQVGTVKPNPRFNFHMSHISPLPKSPSIALSDPNWLQLYASITGSLVAYIDADWAGCPTTRRSTSGYCVFLGDNLLSSSAKRQHTLSRSSAEADAIYMTTNPVQHQRTKHIEIDIQFVRDMVARGQICVLHVPSRYQYADIFTKGLSSALFEEF
ncbi:ribonuclease H-like domain-containing protein, partial [Tanacetum coccineum]